MIARERINYTGFIGFINNIQMTAFAGFNGQVLWFFGSIILTIVDGYLLTRQASEVPLVQYANQQSFSAAVAIFVAHNQAAEQMRQVGLWLAGYLLLGWTGKSVSNAWSNKVVRESAMEYAPVAEAKARGKAQGQLVVKAEDNAKVEAHVDSRTREAPRTGALSGDDERGEE